MSDELVTTLSVLPEATLLISADGVVRGANPPARRLLGPAAEEGARLSDHAGDAGQLARAIRTWSGGKQLMPAAVSLRCVAGLERLRCDGGVVRVRKGERPALLLVRIRTKDAATARFRELTDRIDALTREVVRRRRAEEDAAAQREWLHVTLSSIGDGVIATDREGRVTFVNPAAEEYTGWTEAEAVGRPLREIFVIVNEGTRQSVENPVHRVIREGVVVGLANHSVLVRRDGSELAIADSAAPIRTGPGELVGVVLVFQDETTRRFNERARRELLAQERRLRKRAEDAVRTKDELIASISHELRTPLNAIVGWADALTEGDLEQDKMARGLAVIVRNARIQSRLVEDLLDLSNVVAGRLELRVEPVELVDVTRAAVDSVKHAARAKGVIITTRGVDTPAPVMADAGRVQQAVWNILSNAVKFSERGGRVDVELARVGSHAEIRVRDTGAGMDDEQLERLFEPFWQGDRRYSGAERGLGLGLSIALRIVEAHGGRIRADSGGLGQGATFTLELPVHALAEEPASPPPSSSEPPSARRTSPKSLAGIRVLVVEDEPDSRELVTMLLEARGAEVRAAEDATAALETLDGWIPDVLLSDIAMPVVDGYELIRAIRARPASRGGAVPAAALTAFASTTDKHRAIESGFQRHVAKPATPDQIVRVVIELAKQRA